MVFVSIHLMKVLKETGQPNLNRKFLRERLKNVYLNVILIIIELIIMIICSIACKTAVVSVAPLK